MTVVTKPLVLNETVDTTNEVLSSIAESMASLAQDKDASYLLAQSAQAVATEAKEIAKGAQYAEVFETEALMLSWISNAENKNKLKRGDNLYIKALDVPDYWVTDVLTTADEDGNYYKIAPLATDKVNLENVATTDSEVTTNPDYLVVTAEIGGKQVPMRMAKSEAIKMFNFGHDTIAGLAGGVAQQIGSTTSVKEEAFKVISVGTITDFDNVTQKGDYACNTTSSTGHTPPSGVGYYWIKNVSGGSDIWQTVCFVGSAKNASYQRVKVNGIWSEWSRVDGFGAKTEADLASVVARNMTTDEAMPIGGVYASTQLWAGGPHWAKWNVGANSETEYGDLFAWGATKPYRLNGTTVIDSTDNYSASKAASITKDLKPNEDAATVNMGSGWRMPTKAEFDALIANTDSTWTTIGGVNGRKFADKRDANNYIFFPASGYVGGSSLGNRGSYGGYWARSFRSSSYAWRLHFYSSEQDASTSSRYSGFSVRGVRS